MPYSPEIYQSAALLLERRRDDAERLAERRRTEIYAAIPEMKETDGKLSKELADLSVSLLRSGVDSASLMNEVRLQCEKMKLRRAELLKKNGYPEGYLEPAYSCPKCSDTGRVDGVLCDCYKELCRKLAAEELDKSSGSSACSFDNFSLEFYEDSGAQGAANPRVMMTGIYNSCRNYAESFGADSPSILMIGKTGLGKTHLSLAIAKTVVEHGFGVVYVPAQRLCSNLELEHFSREGGNEFYKKYSECDLLIIDDLGAEFPTQFTVAAIGNLISERLCRKRPTIISTNLGANELKIKYSERTASRLLGDYKAIMFIGRDIRFAKK